MKFKSILEKLGIYPICKESFRILVSSISTILKYAEGDDIEALTDWDAPVLPDLIKLDSSELTFIKSEAQKTSLPIDECQIRVQKLISHEKRKKFAAYYTIQQGTNFMASVVKEFLHHSKKRNVVLADPFLGSGVSLTSTIRRVGVERVQSVWGIEPLQLPALVAYASLVDATKGKNDVITVVVGDAFKEIPEAFSLPQQHKISKVDIILTNPPFTRWKYLEKSYREYLLSVMDRLGYKNYITRKEGGLQTLSMFLSDYILNNNGLIISVLPISTFYTIYGRGYKFLLKENYNVYGIIEHKSRAAFSEDSGFKEVIIVAIKSPNKGLTAFIELNDNVEDAAKIVMHNDNRARSNANIVDIHNLPRFLDINWLALLGRCELRNIVVNIFKLGLKKGTLGYWDTAVNRNNIIRGVEMYGPDFFFIPNKYWETIEDKNNFLRVKNIDDETELTFSKEFLVRTLRKPSLYARKIEAEVNTFMLSIPPVRINELPKDLQSYIKWGFKSKTAKPAINVYGKYWYSHVHKQMITKKPFGRVFIPDKVDLVFRNRSIFANYTKEELSASKNFYIVRGKNEILAKLLIAWFNSTIFISILILLGRKISKTWTRFLENDYLELPVINLNAINNNKDTSEITKSIDKMLAKPLPSLWEQLNKEERYKLDLAIAEFIGIENSEKIIEQLYYVLLNNLPHRTS